MSSWPMDAVSRAPAPTASRRRRGRTRSTASNQRTPKLGVGAVRIDSDIVTWPKRGNAMRREKVAAAPNNRYVGLVLLFSVENGEPLAILPDGVMQRMRVGAANGLGIKHLARNNAKRLGILGSGWQAGAQLMAACAVRDIETIRCFSPNPQSREGFATAMRAALGVDIIPVGQPEEAIEGADNWEARAARWLRPANS